jgi:hemoglobin
LQPFERLPEGKIKKLEIVHNRGNLNTSIMNCSAPLFERLGKRPSLLRLLNHFYADVRQHRLIGPLFERQINNWPQHIENVANFWTQVTGSPGTYAGGMPAHHIPLGLREEHFRAWLGLWDFNCHIWLSSDCADELSSLARQIGQRLRQFCGVPPSSVFIPVGVDFHQTPILNP